ncbi:MAG: hypothetical protein Q6370_007520 [Candidatus Sigynarchaeota archaeon]
MRHNVPSGYRVEIHVARQPMAIFPAGIIIGQINRFSKANSASRAALPPATASPRVPSPRHPGRAHARDAAWREAAMPSDALDTTSRARPCPCHRLAPDAWYTMRAARCVARGERMPPRGTSPVHVIVSLSWRVIIVAAILLSIAVQASVMFPEIFIRSCFVKHVDHR